MTKIVNINKLPTSIINNLPKYLRNSANSAGNVVGEQKHLDILSYIPRTEIMKLFQKTEELANRKRTVINASKNKWHATNELVKQGLENNIHHANYTYNYRNELPRIKIKYATAHDDRRLACVYCDHMYYIVNKDRNISYWTGLERQRHTDAIDWFVSNA